MIALDYPHEAQPAQISVTVTSGFGRMPLVAPKGCRVYRVTTTRWAKRHGIGPITLWLCTRSAHLGQFE
jgi:hypothetical protein